LTQASSFVHFTQALCSFHSCLQNLIHYVENDLNNISGIGVEGSEFGKG